MNNFYYFKVTFCTIGFRSCIEARRLSYKYHLKGHIYSLDGILPYLYSSENNEKFYDCNVNELPILIQPETNQKTNRVHTFGPQWDIAHEEFDSTCYKHVYLSFYSVRVGILSIFRNIQYGLYKVKKSANEQCYLKCKSQR